MQQLNDWLKNNHMLNYSSLVNTLFKQKCLLCDANTDAWGGNTSAVCRGCLNDLPWHPKNACPQCGLSSTGQLCGSCISSPPDFDATISIFLYDFPIEAMMQRYKYGNMLSLCAFFGQMLSEKVSTDSVDLIIPMPMHPQRLKERGFNQALEISKILSISHEEKLDYRSSGRQKLTPPQASLPLKERVKNIKGAFNVNTDLTGKRIAIVDDVMTTGASLNELAKTLKKAGAAHVECWVIARTLPHK
jgi:ComF family protein